MLLLDLHPFQNEVSKEVLSTYLEREFLKATAITGFDLNRAIDSPHWAETLRFVPGLGERKAVALRQSLPKLVRSSTNQGRSNNLSWQDEEAEAAFDVNSYLRSRSLLMFENGGPLNQTSTRMLQDICALDLSTNLAKRKSKMLIMAKTTPVSIPNHWMSHAFIQMIILKRK